MQTNYPHLASRWNSYSVQAFKLALLGFRLLSLKAWRAKMEASQSLNSFTSIRLFLAWC